VVHAWYLLWAVIPLAATRGLPKHRRFVLAASAVLALMVPPTGADFAFRSFQLPLAQAAGVGIFLVTLLAVRRELAREEDPTRAALPGTAVDAPTAVPAAACPAVTSADTSAVLADRPSTGPSGPGPVPKV
jgi:alpha-1,6-mannosyltransferase